MTQIYFLLICNCLIHYVRMRVIGNGTEI